MRHSIRDRFILCEGLSCVALALVLIQGLPACNTSAGGRSETAASTHSKEKASQDPDEDQDEDSKDEESLDISKVPESVRAAAQKYFADLHGCKASRETEHGAQIFEIVGKGEGGRDVSLNISSAGLVFEVEREMAGDALPADVRDALAKHFAGAAVKKAESIEVHTYEIRLTKDGKTFEARITGTGQIMEDEK
jgi:hypothetical protein